MLDAKCFRKAKIKKINFKLSNGRIVKGYEVKAFGIKTRTVTYAEALRFASTMCQK